jgi:formiminotetrahydrofolate cyclodeaminase
MVPQEILSAIGGAAVTALVAVVASGIRSIPFKLMVGNGKNGKTLITKEMLEKNCEVRQTTLDKSLQTIITGLKENSESLGEVREKIAYIEGKVSMRRNQ